MNILIENINLESYNKYENILYDLRLMFSIIYPFSQENKKEEIL